ncbi:MAG: hypothetical protein ACREM2_00325 [Vulcanimicrobiaceae bacterium]
MHWERPADERPRCLACGVGLDAPPEAETIRPRGRFAIVVEWRTCPCGAFARTQRMRRRETSPRLIPR